MQGSKEVSVDRAGRLWIADSGNKRVLRLDNASTIPSGSDADGVLGQSDFTSNANADPPTRSSLNSPKEFKLLLESNLLVLDAGDRRGLRYNSTARKANGASADSVFFQPDFASSGAGLNSDRLGFPIALEIGPVGILWFADFSNNCVLRLDDRDMVGAKPRANAVIGFSDLV